VYHTQGTAVKSRESYDSSPNDEPFEVVLGDDQIIPGWENGIVGKGVTPVRYGGLRKVVAPAKLAYGAEGYGCRYDGSKRGGFKCLVEPGESVEIVFKVLEK
jgi:FKBP-type peptidyl-prolyl cis-trans isomerase 2